MRYVSTSATNISTQSIPWSMVVPDTNITNHNGIIKMEHRKSEICIVFFSVLIKDKIPGMAISREPDVSPAEPVSWGSVSQLQHHKLKVIIAATAKSLKWRLQRMRA